MNFFHGPGLILADMTRLFLILVTALALLAGCATLDEKQRVWIFQPSDRAWSGGLYAAESMDDVWIDFDSALGREPVRLHGLWAQNENLNQRPGAPVMLYLHGARWNVKGSAFRMRRMEELGFSVLGIDYRGFGQSTQRLPSEQLALEDARAAWDWLAERYPDRPRYIFGHSLGGAVAIQLAAEVSDEAGTLVEGTFSSIADVVSTFKWGWLPLSPLITQRFDSVKRVPEIGSPLLVVHGTADTLIPPELAQRLYDAARGPKALVMVEGGSHHNTNSVGQAQYRAALAQLFQIDDEVRVVAR
jgi:pimeloyl-ACP methyl ester carboxylesterase